MLSRDSLQMLQLRVTESLTQLATAFHLRTVYICLSASIQLLYIFISTEDSKKELFKQTYRNIHSNLIGLPHPSKYMFGYTENTAQRDFLGKFQNLAEMLAEDNYYNMRNLNNNNHNINQIFNQFRAIIKKTVNSYRELANRTILLENQLAKKDPYNVLLLEKTKVELSLGDAALRYNVLPSQYYPKLDILARKPESNIPMPSSKKSKTVFHKNIIREQFTLIQQFIHTNLKQSLVADLSKNKTIHKSIIMNLYLRWNELRGRIVPPSKAKLVKTKITEELKKLFPRMDHNENKYRGIAFKEDLVSQSAPREDEVITADQIPELQIKPHECYEAQDLALPFDDIYDEQQE